LENFSVLFFAVEKRLTPQKNAPPDIPHRPTLRRLARPELITAPNISALIGSRHYNSIAALCLGYTLYKLYKQAVIRLFDIPKIIYFV